MAGLTLFVTGIASCSPAPLTPTAASPNFALTLTAAHLADATTRANLANATQVGATTVAQQVELATGAAQTAQASTQIAQALTAAPATQVAQATAQSVLQARLGWASLIQDSFTDNQLGWPIGLKQDHSLALTSVIANGTYQWTVTVTNGNSYFNLIPTHGPVPRNFYALVTVKFDKGNDDGQSAYGLTFNHMQDDYGFFGILKSGSYRALEVHNTGIYQTREGPSAAILTGPGQTNRIAVVGIGSDYIFLINDQWVSSLTADFDPGQIGLGVDAGKSAPEALVEFSDFEIRAP